MEKEERKEIAAIILKKLHLMKKIGGSHTPFENLPKGFPSDMRGEIKKVAEKLIRAGLLTATKHNYGLGVSLNYKKLDEIEAIIQEVFPDF